MQAVKYKGYHLTQKKALRIDSINWDQDGFSRVTAYDDEDKLYADKMIGGDIVLLQFTGAYDRRGTEIYDGDLLEHKGLMFEVMWGINHAWMVRIRNIWATERTDHHVYHPLKWAIDKKHMPKVGSIYDFSKRKRRSYGFNG